MHPHQQLIEIDARVRRLAAECGASESFGHNGLEYFSYGAIQHTPDEAGAIHGRARAETRWVLDLPVPEGRALSILAPGTLPIPGQLGVHFSPLGAKGSFRETHKHTHLTLIWPSTPMSLGRLRLSVLLSFADFEPMSAHARAVLATDNLERIWATVLDNGWLWVDSAHAAAQALMWGRLQPRALSTRDLPDSARMYFAIPDLQSAAQDTPPS